MTTEAPERVEAPETEEKSSDKVPATIALRRSTIVAALLGAVAIAAIAVLAVLWLTARGKLADESTRKANEQHAEQVATDYSVGASTINFQDANAWVAKLKANTAPPLAAKFDATAPKLQEILVPLKWTSTGAPIAAHVASESDGIYKVDVFVNVNSTNAQNPDGTQTTVTYNVTVDSGNGWKITDVGGANGALPLK